MFVEIYRGITLHPGTFAAVVSPEQAVTAALTGNHDLRRFLLLVLTGPGSRLGAGISGTFPDAEIRTITCAGQLLEGLRDAHHTIVLVGHDPALFDGCEETAAPVAAALRALGREALVILHTESRDPVFAALARNADRCLEIVPPDRTPAPSSRASAHSPGGHLPPAQTRLGVS